VSNPRIAALAVCARAIDVQDARLLLTALGLLVDGHLNWPEPGLMEVRDIKVISATGAGGRHYQ
jgi:hypothetical protein